MTGWKDMSLVIDNGPVQTGTGVVEGDDTRRNGSVSGQETIPVATGNGRIRLWLGGVDATVGGNTVQPAPSVQSQGLFQSQHQEPIVQLQGNDNPILCTPSVRPAPVNERFHTVGDGQRHHGMLPEQPRRRSSAVESSSSEDLQVALLPEHADISIAPTGSGQRVSRQFVTPARPTRLDATYTRRCSRS